MELIKRSDNLRGVPVLVTGAGGFIGSHLVEHLLARHAHVTAVARSRDKLALVKNAGSLAHRSCDLSRYDEVEDLISAVRPEVIFHFAAYPDGAEDFERAQDCVAANLTATLNLLEAFRRWPGKLFLYGDSCKVYGDAAVPYREDLPLQPRSSYAITKAAGWQFCQLYRAVHGVPVVSVRPTMIYGPRQSYNLITYVVDCVLQEQAEIRLDGGSQTRDPLFVEDAVEAILLMAGRAEQVTGRVVNLGGGCERTVVEIATAVVQLMDSHLPVVPVPRAMRPTEMRRSYCDNAEAADLLRWCPRRDFHSGLQLTIADLVQARSKRRAAVAAMGD
jgi:nucleoside-diphosphate-sugar epimerase